MGKKLKKKPIIKQIQAEESTSGVQNQEESIEAKSGNSAEAGKHPKLGDVMRRQAVLLKKQAAIIRQWNWVRILIAGVLIVNVISMLIFSAVTVRTLRRMNEVSNQMSYLSDTTSVLLSNVSSMQENIEASLEEQNSLLAHWEISLKEMNFADNSYTVSITVVPKTYTAATQVSVYFGTREFSLKLKSYQYVGEASLTLDESYDGNVTVLLADGDSRQTEVLSNYADVRTNLNSILAGILYEYPTYADGELSMNLTGYLRVDAGDFFNFESLNMVLEVDEEEVRSYDLAAMARGETTFGSIASVSTDQEEEDTLESVIGDILEDDEAENDASAANQAESALPVFDQENSLNWLAYSFAVSDRLPVDPGSDIRIYLKAITDNGYTFTYDLYAAEIVISGYEEIAGQSEGEKEDAAKETANETADAANASDAAAAEGRDSAESLENDGTSGEKADSQTTVNEGETAVTITAASIAIGTIDEESIDLTPKAAIYDPYGGVYWVE